MKRDTVSAYRARAKKTSDEIAATIAEVRATEAREYKEARAAEKRAEQERVRLTRDDILGAKFVRTDYGWKRVRRVNAVTVSVDSGYSWADTVRFDKVLEVKK